MHLLLVGGVAGSIINFRKALIVELIERGWRVTAVAGEGEGFEPAKNELSKIGVELLSVPMARTGVNPLQDIQYFICLLKVIYKVGPDVVISYTSKPVVYTGIALFGKRIRYYPMITGLGYAFSDGKGIKRKFVGLVSRCLYKISLLNARKVIFQNEDDKELFLKLRIMSDGDKACRVYGSGIDTIKFPAAPLPDRDVFLMLARLIEEKGVRHYVDAAREIRKKYPHARFLLAGALDSNPSGIDEEELMSWVDEGTIEYLGMLKDVRSALLQCSCYVLPSYYREGVPRSILEALSIGRPIITTDSVGCRDTIKNGINGVLVEPKSTESLISALESFCEMPFEVRANMALASLDLVKSRFDVRLVNESVLEAICS